MALPKTWQHVRHHVFRRRRIPRFNSIDITRGRPSRSAVPAVEIPQFLKDCGHDYLETTMDDNGCPELTSAMKELEKLRTETERFHSQQLSVHNLKHNPRLFKFYTNLPNFDVFNALREYLETRANGNVKRWHGSKAAVELRNENVTGMRKFCRGSKLSFENELFLILVKLKTGRLNQDLAFQFCVSIGYISELFTSWMCFLHSELKLLFEMIDCGDTVDGLPSVYKNLSALRIIIDCTELMLQKSSDLQERKETFSNYKHRDTVKFLVGMSPHLYVNFVSKAWAGRASDKHITMNSDALLGGLPPGSVVMADRGFTVTAELSKLGVKTVIPAFKGRGRSQFTAAECSSSEDIARARIHIERAIQRIRTFHILGSVVKMNMCDIIEQIFAVCAYMTNFQTPIINLNEIKPV